ADDLHQRPPLRARAIQLARGRERLDRAGDRTAHRQEGRAEEGRATRRAVRGALRFRTHQETMRAGEEGGGCFPTGRHYPGIAHLLRIVAQGLVDEFDGSLTIGDLLLVSIDTETTGKDPAVDRVVELAAVVFKCGEVISRHRWLV